MILDVTSGARTMWFDRGNPEVVFGDLRAEEVVLPDRRLRVVPDVQLDFRALPFADGAFQMVIFDPPHMVRAGKRSWLAAKYGRLSPHWQDDLRRGFSECWRVLDTDGVLIFKWSQYQVPVSEVLALAPAVPLFGHRTRGSTMWLVFVKQRDRRGRRVDHEGGACTKAP